MSTPIVIVIDSLELPRNTDEYYECEEVQLREKVVLKIRTSINTAPDSQSVSLFSLLNSHSKYSCGTVFSRLQSPVLEHLLRTLTVLPKTLTRTFES